MSFFSNVHMISHLHKMCLHYFIVAQFFVIINFLTKLDHISWIDSFFVIKVPNISNTSKMFIWQLWIRVRTMEPILYSAGLNGCSSTLLHRWSKNTKVSSLARTDRLSTIACLISISAKPTFSIVSALSVITERFPINLIISWG